MRNITNLSQMGLNKLNILRLSRGSLYRHELSFKNSKRNEINHKLVLLLSLNHLVLKELHDPPLGGH